MTAAERQVCDCPEPCGCYAEGMEEADRGHPRKVFHPLIAIRILNQNQGEMRRSMG